jgi:hypothetical protein
LIGVGICLLTMVTIQHRRERMNRQINERLRALIAACKTLGRERSGRLERQCTFVICDRKPRRLRVP